MVHGSWLRVKRLFLYSYDVPPRDLMNNLNRYYALCRRLRLSYAQRLSLFRLCHGAAGSTEGHITEISFSNTDCTNLHGLLTKISKTLPFRLRLRLWCRICVLFLVCEHPDKSPQTRHQSLGDSARTEEKPRKSKAELNLFKLCWGASGFASYRKTEKIVQIPNL